MHVMCNYKTIKMKVNYRKSNYAIKLGEEEGWREEEERKGGEVRDKLFPKSPHPQEFFFSR